MRNPFICGVLVLAFTTPSAARAQVRVDSLPCDSWLTSIANGLTVSDDWDPLYRIDACVRLGSVKTAAREQGVRALLLRNDVSGASLNLSYLQRDSLWVANTFVPFVLPTIVDRSKPNPMRGQLMMLLANTLQPKNGAVRAVYNPAPGDTPATSSRCTNGTNSESPFGTVLPQAAINTIYAAAERIRSDSTEAPQLREAAKCLLRAAAEPGRPLRRSF